MNNKMGAIVLIVFALSLVACGNDDLTKEKVLDILKEHESNIPTKECSFLSVEGKVYLGTDQIPTYQSLEDKGLISFDSVRRNVFLVKMTKKGNEYLAPKKRKKNIFFNGSRKHFFFVYTFRYAPQTVEIIYNVPESNKAVAKVFYSVQEKTPFAILEEEREGKTFIRHFKKTTDGWKFENP